MARIIWTEPALQKLDEIADYISLHNPAAAKKLVRKFFKRADNLAHHPKSGKHMSVRESSDDLTRRFIFDITLVSCKM
ncbi:MAG: type II toxin-antitoxin system RelE/ParE family toxin [Balneolaceae bacterium]|nr:type II toxin-antitoxin system RelE/ParE family toxin [Balneolaceae bacterium]